MARETKSDSGPVDGRFTPGEEQPNVALMTQSG